MPSRPSLRSPVVTILDTHVWIWMVEGDDTKLSRSAVQEIERSAKAGLVRVCPITIWEVAMLEAKGRLSLSRPIEEWVRDALRAPGVRLEPMSPEIAIESARLPGSPHGDPADRILMASARVLGGRLATCDSKLIEYSKLGNLNVLDSGV
jgi:PIN domain nuclease of toxin-antitoxin system